MRNDEYLKTEKDG